MFNIRNRRTARGKRRGLSSIQFSSFPSFVERLQKMKGSDVEVTRMQGQVAGHLWEENKVGFLSVPGMVLKPMEGERGQRELKFYSTMQAQGGAWYLCGFHGTRDVSGTLHLVLSDLREGMIAPCVMDLKVR
jgi:hypothetical protein